jgi:hypothetical protein
VIAYCGFCGQPEEAPAEVVRDYEFGRQELKKGGGQQKIAAKSLIRQVEIKPTLR